MNKNTSVMAAAIAIAGILTLAVLAHQAFAGNFCCDDDKNKQTAVGGNGGSGGAGGAGGEGGQGGKNVAEDNKAKIDQDANGGYANGGHGGNANGGNART
jgi:hypothetical protein